MTFTAAPRCPDDDKPVADVAVIRDVTADEWEAARADVRRSYQLHRRAVRRLKVAEKRLEDELGAALIGVRPSGRAVVEVQTQDIPERIEPAHTRRDLRVIHERQANGNGEGHEGSAQATA